MDTIISSTGLQTNLNTSASHSKHSVADVRSNDTTEVIEMATVGVAPTKGPSIDTHNGETVIQTKSQKQWETVQFLALCWSLFLAGWNDGSAGPMIPRLQSVYHVGFTVVSLLFVLACVGFIFGALINMPLTDRLGFGKLIFFGSCCQVVAYIIQSFAPPFPLFIISFMINGIGIALQDAQANGYVSTLPSSADSRMGLLHAAYGAGAFCSPLIATHFSETKHWEFHYLTSLGVALINTLILAIVFRFRSHDKCLEDIGQPPMPNENTSEHGNFRQIMGLRNVHLMAIFIFVYVGVEVTIGGWIVSYVRDVRGGGASSGYISSGFFGGLMTGRVVLLWVNKKVGEQRVLYAYALIAIGLEFVIWFVPSLIGNAIAVSFVGLLLGPIYPIAMNVTGRVLPPRILTASIGWIAGLGQAGSAVLPFMTGALAGRVGIRSLEPLLISMMAFMVLLWALIPRKRPHSD